MKTHKRAWLLIGILACSAAAILAAGAAGSRKPQQHVPFTITLKAEDHYDDGRVVQAFTETRYVSSTGDWRGLRQLPSGAIVERVGIAGRGVYTIDAQAQKMWFNSPYSERFPKAGERQRSENYVRTETVMGYVADVVRVEAEAKSAEFYQAPDLNNFTIKQVEREDGFTRVIEPTTIIPGEPADQALKYQEYAEDRSLYKAGGRFKAQPQETDSLPVADYSSPAPTDATERVKRKARNKRYNKSGSRPIEDAPDSYEKVWSPHWLRGLSALPVAQSDIVLVGEIMDAQAYLSEDRTGVYSEFPVRIKEVLKNDNNASLYPDGMITINRFGGAVRFPSGRIQKFRVGGQGIPVTGRQYLVFLKRADQEQDFSLITGYELRGERVLPLDGSNTGGDGKVLFDQYKGADVSTFLKAVRDVITQAAKSSSEGRN